MAKKNNYRYAALDGPSPAQAQNEINNTYGYDVNGNQTTRTIDGVTTTLGYDPEGYLVSVAGKRMATSLPGLEIGRG